MTGRRGGCSPAGAEKAAGGDLAAADAWWKGAEGHRGRLRRRLPMEERTVRGLREEARGRTGAGWGIEARWLSVGVGPATR